MSDLEAVELERAAEILHEDGWVQANLAAPEGFCLLGAVGRARNERGRGISLSWADAFDQLHMSTFMANGIHAANEIAQVMGLGPTWRDAATWNDTTGRTKQEVIDRLMLGAKNLREAGR